MFESSALKYVDVAFRDPQALVLRKHIGELLCITRLRMTVSEFHVSEENRSFTEVVVKEGDTFVDCHRRADRFRNSGNLYVCLERRDYSKSVPGKGWVSETRHVRITSGLTKLDEIARYDVARQQVKRWTPVVKEYLRNGGELRHVTLPFDYLKLELLDEDSRRMELVRLWNCARDILRSCSEGGLVKYEPKITRKGVHFHFHLIMLNPVMSYGDAVAWLGCIRTAWFEASGSKYVNVKNHGQGVRGVGYITNYVNKPYVELGCGVDVGKAAGLLVRMARELYRKRTLVDYGLRGLRRRLLHVEHSGFRRASEGGCQETQAGIADLEERSGDVGAADISYASIKENNSGPLSVRWSFGGLFYASRPSEIVGSPGGGG